MNLLSHPFLRGKDECSLLEFPGAAGGVQKWGGEGNGKSRGRVKGDTDTHPRLNRRRPGTAVPGTGMIGRRKRFGHLVGSGQLSGVPTRMLDTEPRRMEGDSIPYPSVRGKTTNGGYSREHCGMPENTTPRRIGIEGGDKQLPLLRECHMDGIQEAAGLTSPPPRRMVDSDRS